MVLACPFQGQKEVFKLSGVGVASLTCDLYPEGQKPGYCGY